MAGRSRFAIAEKSIRLFFDKSENRVFSTSQLNSIRGEKQGEWNLPFSGTTDKFIDQLLKKEILQEAELSFEGSYAKHGLYATADATVYQIALALHAKAYLSHYTAVVFQNLTVQVPKTVYVTFERSNPILQKTKPALEQQNVDAAFSKPQKKAGSFAEYKGQRIYILNGQYTNQLGVYSEDGHRITNLERTLIDITVRPAYSGGVTEVLNAYREAKSRLSINKFVATLKRMDFIYPYHQAVGFYLDRAGFSETQLEPFRQMGLDIDFYLTYDMPSKVYSTQWRLYHPEGM